MDEEIVFGFLVGVALSVLVYIGAGLAGKTGCTGATGADTCVRKWVAE